MKTIYLTRGFFAIVDDEDYERVSCFKWRVNHSGNTYYAMRTDYSTGRKRSLFLHHFLLNAGRGQCVDHMNRDGLDNRKSNLRFCTRSQNRVNSYRPHGSSRFKGVSWNRKDRKWHASIGYQQRKYFLGYFKNEEDAARAYDQAACRLHGEFAAVNFSVEMEAIAVPNCHEQPVEAQEGASAFVDDGLIVQPATGPLWHLVRDGGTLTLSYDDGVRIALIAFPLDDAPELAERLLRMVRDAHH